MNKGYSPQKFIGLIGTVDTDRRVSEMLEAEFGPLPKVALGGGGNAMSAI
jgi:hypothetical protein